jgi:hypothetical protein
MRCRQSRSEHWISQGVQPSGLISWCAGEMKVQNLNQQQLRNHGWCLEPIFGNQGSLLHCIRDARLNPFASRAVRRSNDEHWRQGRNRGSNSG